jgi:TonB family protein
MVFPMKITQLVLNRARPAASVIALLQLAILLSASFFARPVYAADNQPASAARAIKQKVAPQYPEIARRMHISGSVKIEATVNPEGTVVSTKAIDGNRMLSSAAEDAVQKWKFVAGPETSTVEVEINFSGAH